MALYYIYLVQLYAFKGEQRNVRSRQWSLLLAGSMIILFQPALGEVFFWRTGSTNYMWGMCLLLTFVFPLRCYVCGRDLLGNVGVIIWNKLHRKKAPIWIFTSFISFSSGFFYMLKAPSTAIRVAYYNQIYETTDFHIKDYFSRIPNIVNRFFQIIGAALL